MTREGERHEDVAVRLGQREAQGERGIARAFRERVDPGAHLLGDPRGSVEAETERRGEELLGDRIDAFDRRADIRRAAARARRSRT